MIETKRPLKVFLCHASADKPKVRELYRTVKRRGMQPWLDAEDLIPGQNWEIEIPLADSIGGIGISNFARLSQLVLGIFAQSDITPICI